MWGPDLTIRALYITCTLKGGMDERRAGEVKRHTHTHIRTRPCARSGMYLNNTAAKTGVQGAGHSVNTSKHTFKA